MQPMGKRGPMALWSPKPVLPYCFFTVCGGLAWVATRTGNMGSAVRRCSTFVRIKRGFGYTQATREANITKEAATISLKCADFQFVVRGYHPVPVQPPLPDVGHSIGHINVHDACSFPVPSPPRC